MWVAWVDWIGLCSLPRSTTVFALGAVLVQLGLYLEF
jgi:hypothetical protein